MVAHGRGRTRAGDSALLSRSKGLGFSVAMRNVRCNVLLYFGIEGRFAVFFSRFFCTSAGGEVLLLGAFEALKLGIAQTDRETAL